ncbi:PREDICTED: UPF0725 protein EMB2204-like [Camelina sativa]|uniref:UPF0725 protein EMB2204-like n=1 Tax=Camelina sativa TaxID=90675 RepID=A0ABM1QVV9_CAMSA|nr:PREDICTED: UPF0725 protein EMB2204-like [Camelina sativa]
MIRRLAYTQDIIPLHSSESDGFDFPNGNTNTHFECGGKYPSYPFRSLVKLYARLGLHRYNLLELSLQSFNMRVTGGPSSYYLSLVARVPDSRLQQAFQVLVQERSFGFLDLGCPIARPLVTTKEPHSDPTPPPDVITSVRVARQ